MYTCPRARERKDAGSAENAGCVIERSAIGLLDLLDKYGIPWYGHTRVPWHHWYHHTTCYGQLRSFFSVVSNFEPKKKEKRIGFGKDRFWEFRVY